MRMWMMLDIGPEVWYECTLFKGIMDGLLLYNRFCGYSKFIENKMYEPSRELRMLKVMLKLLLYKGECKIVMK